MNLTAILPVDLLIEIACYLELPDIDQLLKLKIVKVDEHDNWPFWAALALRKYKVPSMLFYWTSYTDPRKVYLLTLSQRDCTYGSESEIIYTSSYRYDINDIYQEHFCRLLKNAIRYDKAELFKYFLRLANDTRFSEYMSGIIYDNIIAKAIKYKRDWASETLSVNNDTYHYHSIAKAYIQTDNFEKSKYYLEMSDPIIVSNNYGYLLKYAFKYNNTRLIEHFRSKSITFADAMFHGYLMAANNERLEALLNPQQLTEETDWFLNSVRQTCQGYPYGLSSTISLVKLSYLVLYLLNEKCRNDRDDPIILLNIIWNLEHFGKSKGDINPLIDLYNPEHISKYKYCLSLISDKWRLNLIDQYIANHCRQEKIISKLPQDCNMFSTSENYIDPLSYYIRLILITLAFIRINFEWQYNKVLNYSLVISTRVGDLYITQLLVGLGATNIKETLRKIMKFPYEDEYQSDGEFDDEHPEVVNYLKALLSDNSVED